MGWGSQEQSSPGVGMPGQEGVMEGGVGRFGARNRRVGDFKGSSLGGSISGSIA